MIRAPTVVFWNRDSTPAPRPAGSEQPQQAANPASQMQQQQQPMNMASMTPSQGVISTPPALITTSQMPSQMPMMMNPIQTTGFIPQSAFAFPGEP
jgi:hypothetical protein